MLCDSGGARAATKSLRLHLRFRFLRRSPFSVGVPGAGADVVVVRRTVRHAVLAGRFCRLPVVDHFSRGVHQRHGGQRAGGVLP
ncbi:hypothetical protein D3C86_2050430 [compost metagenome]